MTLAPEDERWLERTLELAERGRRTASPNPVVGCVLVRDGRVIGEGWHVRKYENHAEGNALAYASRGPGRRDRLRLAGALRAPLATPSAAPTC